MMKKLPLLQPCVFLIFLLMSFFNSNAQIGKNFNVRYQGDIKGDMTIISNNIVNRYSGALTPEDAYDGSNDNHTAGVNMQYIDIDSDATTFSSSSATLNFDNPSSSECNEIVYAGLYWFAMRGAVGDMGAVETDTWDEIKLKLPGSTTYTDITAEVADAYDGASINTQRPYYCYKEITDLIIPLADASGEYVVANIQTLTGVHASGGGAGGWMIVVAYENAALTQHAITTYDGFALIEGPASSTNSSLDIAYSGFTTSENAPVNAKIAVGVIEGDRGPIGPTFDRISLKSDDNSVFTVLSDAMNPADNFFNSTISINGENVTSRNPSSSNTLGVDVDYFNLNNPGNSVVGNGETGVTLRLESTGERFGHFFNAFVVENAVPDILLTSAVEDAFGNDINGSNVSLGDELEYVISFQNNGSVDLTDVTIEDDLPANIDFIELASSLVMPTGVTYTYDVINHKLIFNIPDDLVAFGGPVSEIRFSANVVNSCSEIRDACSNVINNHPSIHYKVAGDDTDFTELAIGSVDNCSNGIEEGTTIYLEDLGGCNTERDEVLCGDSILLIAGAGFETYQWYNNDTVIPGATSQTLNVTEAGTYRVEKTSSVPCLTFNEVINVNLFSNSLINPIVSSINNGDINGEIVTCFNDGLDFPKLFLCGFNDSALIDTDITNAESITWEMLDPGSCSDVGVPNDDCPNTNTECIWTTVHTGNDYNADTSGEFRLTINYQNGCSSRFYFDVYQNDIVTEVSVLDIACNTSGFITVHSPAAADGYEFQLIDVANNPVTPYQTNNEFEITTPGEYSVNVRQLGGSCVFTAPSVIVNEVTPYIYLNTVNPLCSGELGSVTVQLIDGQPEYVFELYDANTNVLIESTPPQASSIYTFTDLASGTYTVFAGSTSDTCQFSENFVIEETTELVSQAIVTSNISCTSDGTIGLTASGGLPPYNYALYSYDGIVQPDFVFQTSPIFDIETGQEGTYVFMVTDRNNCTSITNAVSIEAYPPTDFSVFVTDITCNGTSDGSIEVNVNDNNNGPILYSLNGGAYQSSPVFSGLTAGNYTISVLDANGCENQQVVTILEPAPLDVVAILNSGCVDNESSVELTASGGTPPYTYSLDGVVFTPSPIFENLAPGSYTPYVQDANGCLAIQTVTIPTSGMPTDLDFIVDEEISCYDSTATVTVNAIGGFEPLIYTIISPTIFISNSSGVFTSVPAGDYTLEVTNSNGCTYSENFTIDLDVINPIAITDTFVSNEISCFGNNDAEISFSVANFSDTYSYELINGNTAELFERQYATSSNTINISGLTVGDHILTVFDDLTTCYDTTVIRITEPDPIVTTTTLVTPITCVNAAEISVTATGGSGSYQYSLELPEGIIIGPQASGVFTGLVSAGNYIVRVTDANGCESIDQIVVEDVIPPASLDIVATEITCLNNTADVTIISVGGQAPLIYEVIDTTSTIDVNSTGIFTGLLPGTYIFQVTDSNGCMYQEAYTIQPVEPLTLDFTIEQMSCENENSGSVQINAIGGTGTYEYVLTTPDGSLINSTANEFTGLSEVGVYTITVTDSGGCIFTTDFILEENTQNCNPTDEDFEESVSIYPNPVRFIARINVEDGFVLYRAELISLSGHIIKDKTFNSEQEAFIYMFNVARGMYFLRLTSTDGLVAYKRILRR